MNELAATVDEAGMLERRPFVTVDTEALSELLDIIDEASELAPKVENLCARFQAWREAQEEHMMTEGIGDVLDRLSRTEGCKDGLSDGIYEAMFGRPLGRMGEAAARAVGCSFG